MFDLATGDIYSTDCVWCANFGGAAFRIPAGVRDLFTEMDGRRLSDMSLDGRLERLANFVAENEQVIALDPEDTSSRSRISDIYTPIFNEESWPRSPDQMAMLPVGTRVLVDTRSGVKTTAEINTVCPPRGACLSSGCLLGGENPPQRPSRCAKNLSVSLKKHGFLRHHLV